MKKEGPDGPSNFQRGCSLDLRRKIGPTARDHAVDKAGYKQNHENNRKEFCYLHESSGQTAESEDGGENGKNKESDDPVKHDALLQLEFKP